MGDKLSHQEFILKAIVALRTGQTADGKQYLGIHSVFSGFNAAFREYFPDDNPVEVVNALAAKGVIATILTKGGVRIYLAADKPKAVSQNPQAILAKMGL